MAYGINFPGTNVTLGAPKGHDNVSALHVFRNREMVVSCWELEPDELRQVAEFGKIYLGIMGVTMAPAIIGSYDVMRSFTADFGILPTDETYAMRARDQ